MNGILTNACLFLKGYDFQIPGSVNVLHANSIPLGNMIKMIMSNSNDHALNFLSNHDTVNSKQSSIYNFIHPVYNVFVYILCVLNVVNSWN